MAQIRNDNVQIRHVVIRQALYLLHFAECRIFFRIFCPERIQTFVCPCKLSVHMGKIG